MPLPIVTEDKLLQELNTPPPILVTLSETERGTDGFGSGGK